MKRGRTKEFFGENAVEGDEDVRLVPLGTSPPFNERPGGGDRPSGLFEAALTERAGVMRFTWPIGHGVSKEAIRIRFWVMLSSPMPAPGTAVSMTRRQLGAGLKAVKVDSTEAE
jgi:hypothetical protein